MPSPPIGFIEPLSLNLAAHIHHICTRLSCCAPAAPSLPPLSSVAKTESPQTPPHAEPTHSIHRTTQFELGSSHSSHLHAPQLLCTRCSQPAASELRRKN